MRRFGSKILAGLKTRKRNRRLSLHNSHVFEGAVLNKNFCNVISCDGNFYSSSLDAMGFHFANIPDKNLIHVYKGFTLVNFITNVRHNLQYIHFGKFDKFRLFLNRKKKVYINFAQIIKREHFKSFLKCTFLCTKPFHYIDSGVRNCGIWKFKVKQGIRCSR